MERLVKDTQQLLLNNHETTLFYEIKTSLQECLSFQFNVAFVTFGGVQLFAEVFNKLEQSGVKGKIITSTYLAFSEPKAIRKLNDFNNIEIKLHYDNKQGLHAKAYIFELVDTFKVIIGSSNLTEKALKSNIEWNVMTITKKGQPFFESVQEEYEDIWTRLDPFDESRFDKYTELYNSLKTQKKLNYQIPIPDQEVVSFKPNAMQVDAIENLNFIRENEGKRALVVAATGTGKTIMSALDVKQVQPNRVLYVVHRENILNEAISTFKAILGKKIYITKYHGINRDSNANYVFTMVQTLANDLESFNKDYFDYIIIDEAHHASASTYQSIIKYFTPKFLLGMTATPERMDGANIFQIFDYNVGVELRLDRAIDSNLVVPFHYFGITDIEDIDLSGINISKDISEISKKLQVNKRTDYIIEKMNLFGHDGEKLKCIGFCVDINHANFMSESFNKNGIPSVAITSVTSSPKKREALFNRLEDEEDELKVIFAVDTLNEGVDIPSVNMVLMLRPTNSPTIFIQQIGRGLRKFEDKKFLTILDFIGNHNRTFLVSLALHGDRYPDKDSLKIDVKKDFPLSPKNVFIQMDEITKERIINQLNQTSFNDFEYLVQDYEEFKKSIKGVIPFKLRDYYVHEGSPDPLRFSKAKFFKSEKNKTKKNSYLYFLGIVEKENLIIQRMNQDNTLLDITQSLHEFLPLVRPHEFLILRHLLNYREVEYSEINKIIQQIVKGDQTKNTAHAIKVLNHERYNHIEAERFVKMINKEDDRVKLSPQLISTISDYNKLQVIEDIIDYGIKRYFDKFGYLDYGKPFLKKYAGYTMRDVALVSNTENKLSSFRGEGVLTFKHHYFLFVNLHKDANIKESIKYNDKFMDYETNMFQWESPGSTSQTTKRGKLLINHKKHGIILHLFVRKMKEIDDATIPFIYLGEVDVVSYEDNNPIRFLMKFKDKVPYDVYNDLTIKVD